MYGVPVITLWYGKYDGGKQVGGIQFQINAESNEIIDIRFTYLEY